MDGISFFDEIPVTPKPTLTEMLAALNSAQKLAVLDAYCHRNESGNKPRNPRWVKKEHGVKRVLTIWLYSKIEEIENAMKALMNGSTPPATEAQMKAAIRASYSSDQTGDPNQFNDGQCNAVVAKIVDVSKYNGSGTWNYYKDNVIY